MLLAVIICSKVKTKTDLHALKGGSSEVEALAARVPVKHTSALLLSGWSTILRIRLELEQDHGSSVIIGVNMLP